MKSKSQLWGKLKHFLIDKQPFVANDSPALNLFPVTQNGDVTSFRISEEIIVHQLLESRAIRFEDRHRIFQEGIDSTGFLYWPAEQILAYFCLQNQSLLANVENVIELGAGKSGYYRKFAGIVVGLILKKQFKHMLITDGKQEVISDLKQNVLLNGFEVKDDLSVGQATVSELKWSDNIPLKMNGKSVILVADCLFFEDYHEALILTIRHFLVSEEVHKDQTGMFQSFCLVCAPDRGGSKTRFLEKLSGFHLEYVSLELKEPYYLGQLDKAQSEQGFDKDRHLVGFYSIRLKQ